MERSYHFVSANSGGNDVVGIRSPDEGIWIVVVFSEITVDRGQEVDQRTKESRLTRQRMNLEEAFARIEPGSRGRGQVERLARVGGQTCYARQNRPIGAVVISYDRLQLLPISGSGPDFRESITQASSSMASRAAAKPDTHFKASSIWQQHHTG